MCVFSKTAEALVLDRLIEAALTVSPGKCKFTASETTFLGYTVSREGLKQIRRRCQRLGISLHRRTCEECTLSWGCATPTGGSSESSRRW